MTIWFNLHDWTDFYENWLIISLLVLLMQLKGECFLLCS